MSTVGQIIDRTYRDFLHPADDQPVILTLSSATDSATTLTFNGATLGPDELDLLAPGVLVEAGLEQMRVTDVDVDASTVDVIRGVNGTTAATIGANTELVVAPAFSRLTVFDAVADNIEQLFPDLWVDATATLVVASGVTEIPVAVAHINSATIVSNGYPSPVAVDIYPSYPPSATGKGAVFRGASAGRTVYLAYEGRFTRPTLEADVLADLGVDSLWERIVVVGAAAQAVAGREMDRLTAEYITEQLQTEASPAGSAQRARDGLLQLHRLMLAEANRNLRSTRKLQVVMVR